MCFFLNKKVSLLVSELYIYQNTLCNNKKKIHVVKSHYHVCVFIFYVFQFVCLLQIIHVHYRRIFWCMGDCMPHNTTCVFMPTSFDGKLQ